MLLDSGLKHSHTFHMEVTLITCIHNKDLLNLHNSDIGHADNVIICPAMQLLYVLVITRPPRRDVSDL